MARACERVRGVPGNLRVARDRATRQNAAADGAVLIAQEVSTQLEHSMAIHPSAVAAISAADTAAAAQEVAVALERCEAEAVAREAAAAPEARTAQEAIAKKEAEVRALEEAVAQERVRKEAEERARADATKREAIGSTRQKVAAEKAWTDAETRALEPKKARLLMVREEEAALAHEEAKWRAAEATAAAMHQAEKKIKRDTPPGGSRVDTVRRLLEGDFASRMKIDLDTEDSRSSKCRGRLPRHRPQGQEKDPQKSTEARRGASPRLQLLRHLQPWGRTRPPASARVHWLRAESGRSRGWRTTSLSQQGKHPVPTPAGVLIPMGRHGL